MKRRKTEFNFEWLKSHTVIDSNGCWLWQRGLTKKGYGLVVDQRNVTRRVHRAAWTMMRGPIPQGLCVCHDCDVKACINPDHLYLATSAQNTRDAISKGLMNPKLFRGEQCGHNKLTETDVRFIRLSASSNSALAKLLNVSRSTIRQIRAGDTWKHI